jgi:hypothetical protein
MLMSAPRNAFLLSLLTLVPLAAACGSASDTKSASGDTAADAGNTAHDGGSPGAAADSGPAVDNGAPSTTYPAPHPALPELVNQAGGKVLVTPKVYLVFFPGYPYQAQVEGLAKALGPSSYWSATTAEYGVGKIDYAGSKVLDNEVAPASIKDTDVEKFMNDKISSGAFGMPDESTLYAIFYPQTTTISSGSGGIGGGNSCTSFGGYHSDTTVGAGGAAKNYAFAVLPTCASFGGLAGADGLTGAFTHEVIEAVTDPFPSTNQGADSAYSSVDMDHFIWILFGGTESGDLCVPEKDAFVKLAEVGYTVQRTWSNKLAKAGNDPCAPNMPGSAYFNSAPVLPESVTLTLPANFGGGNVPTKGVKIPVGQKRTIEVDLFSDGPTTGPWTVSAIDALAKAGGSTLDFSWDRTTGVNGEKLHLTIEVKAASTFVPGAHPFIIASTQGGREQQWPALVVEK